MELYLAFIHDIRTRISSSQVHTYSNLLVVTQRLACLVSVTVADRYSHMSGCTADYMFAIKSLMKAQPYTVLVIALLVSVA